MAAGLHVSAGHFQTIFKDLFSTTVMSEVIESRIRRAKELLADTDLLIYEISALCGYQNDVHFMRQFKESTALTPSQYRKNFNG